MKKASEREKRVAKLSTLDAKLLSFSYSASGVSWNRFCNMWLLKSGFSPREVGLMKSLSLVGKFVAGYDAVCFVHSDPQCILSGGREDDGSFDPDDGNQHGTACMGMASATGLEADGTQTAFYGSAPDAGLVDVRIGTDVGAGPFENYLLEQEFYELSLIHI